MPTNSTLSFDAGAPWGNYAPTGLAAFAIQGCQALPGNPRLFYTLNKGLRGPIKSAEPRYFDVEALGLKLRLLTRGNYCETTTLFAPQFYDREELDWLRQGLGNDSVFIDVGGNVGLYSLVAAHNNASTRVIAVEPNTALTQRLRFNAMSNNLSIEICETALSDYSGSGTLSTTAKQSGQNQLDTRTDNETAGAANSPGNEVEVTTLPALLDSLSVSRIDVLKIDIEGHEHRVLKHFFEQSAASLHPSRIIIEHVHDHSGTIDMLTGSDIDYKIENRSARNLLLSK